MGLVIDSFAGAGGASLGIERAIGRSPDIAINHDAAALRMHEANHPKTRHVLEDVHVADLPGLVGNESVDFLWASPDCRHFSRAKGSKPVSKSVRSLAWVVCKWASKVEPEIIVLENVREFADWGPLIPAWRCQKCGWRGTEGQAVLVRTRRKCPRCESRSLRMTEDLIPDPTRKGLTFRRFIGRLRNLGYAVEWRSLNAADFGAPTHRRRLFVIARRDGNPIEWPEPTHCDPDKVGDDPLFGLPLKPWRTAAECIDWDVPCPSIFDRKRPLAEKTLRRIALGIKRYILENPRPFIVRYNGARSPRDFRGQEITSPFTTSDTQPRFGLTTPIMIPLTHHGDRRSHELTEPVPTITTAKRGEVAVVAAFLAKHFGGVVGVEVDTPLPTSTTRSTQNQIVAANIVHLNHGEKQWSAVDDPMRTLTTGNHAVLVYSFLVKYFGTAIGQLVEDPLHAVTSKDRFGVVTVNVDGELYAIVDIGMRMLLPRELARAQGFPDSYVLTGSKTCQVASIGNSVSPVVAEAVVRANMRVTA